MKKILLCAVASTAMFTLASCVSEDQELAQTSKESDKGYITLNLSQDDALSTRAIHSTNATGDEISLDASAWTVNVTGSTNYQGTVAGLANQAFAAATGYRVTASNYSNLAAALAANGGLGDAFYSGTSDAFEVTAGGTATPTVVCGQAQNARLTIDASAFANITITSMTVSGTNGDDAARIVSFPTTQTSTTAYFVADEELTYTINYKAANNEDKSINQTITLGVHTSNNITLTSNATGLINVTITYNDTFENGQSQSYTIDAATGNQVPQNP